MSILLVERSKLTAAHKVAMIVGLHVSWQKIEEQNLGAISRLSDIIKIV